MTYASKSRVCQAYLAEITDDFGDTRQVDGAAHGGLLLNGRQMQKSGGDKVQANIGPR